MTFVVYLKLASDDLLVWSLKTVTMVETNMFGQEESRLFISPGQVLVLTWLRGD